MKLDVLSLAPFPLPGTSASVGHWGTKKYHQLSHVTFMSPNFGFSVSFSTDSKIMELTKHGEALLMIKSDPSGKVGSAANQRYGF